MTLRWIIYWLLNGCFLAGILYVVLWVPWSQRPDSSANRELFRLHTRMQPDLVTNLRVHAPPGFNGYHLQLFRFDYSSDTAISHLVRNLSLETKPAQSFGTENIQWWQTSSKDLEYLEDTDIDHAPVISVWIDRNARRCFVRMASS